MRQLPARVAPAAGRGGSTAGTGMAGGVTVAGACVSAAGRALAPCTSAASAVADSSSSTTASDNPARSACTSSARSPKRDCALSTPITRRRGAAARRRASSCASGRVPEKEMKQQSAAATAAVHPGVSGSATMTSGRGPGSARSRLRSNCDSSGSSQASSTRGTWRAGTSVMCRAALQSPAGDRRCPGCEPGCTGFYCHAAQAASGNKEDRAGPAIAGAAASR